VDNSFYLKDFLREIYNQTMLLAQRFKIRLYNCEMNILYIPNRLQLNNNRIIYNEIESMPSNFDSFVFDNDFSLSLNLKVPLLQLNDKRVFVDGLQKSRT
jgi:hypothetical protein